MIFSEKKKSNILVYCRQKCQTTSPGKYLSNKNMPAPINVTKLRSFIGLVSHYSAFFSELHQVHAPSTIFWKIDVAWEWSDAWLQKGKVLPFNLLLIHYKPSMDIVWISGASDNGIGAVISHLYPDDSQKVIAHASWSLTPAKLKKESLAIISAIKKITQNSALTSFHSNHRSQASC